MNGKKLKSILPIIITIFTAVILGTVGIIYAFVNQSVHRDYETSITATYIAFKFNNKIYLDEIGSKDINLEKGVPAEIDMTIEITGSNSLIVDYFINFDLQNAAGEETDISEIVEAIEVYVWDGNTYEYMCMLNDVENHTISGTMVTNYQKTIPVKFVFSQEAGKYYDNIANSDNNGFRLKATASANLSSSSESYVFANDEESLINALTASDTANKTIVLISDITLSSDVTCNGKRGIDLNGNTLTLNGNINISYSETNYHEIGLINTAAVTNDTKEGGLAGSGTITVAGNDCYLVDDYVNTDKISVSTENQSVFNSLSSLIQKRIYAFNAEKKIITSGSDISYVLNDLRYYFDKLNFVIASDEESAFAVNNTNITVNIVNDVTTKFMYNLTLTDGVSTSSSIKGTVIVRGNSLNAIATALLEEISSPINSSIYLKGYDTTTGSYIDWIIEDGHDGLILDSNGRYKRNGLDAYISTLTDYADISASVYVKITKGTETGMYNANKTVETVSAQERTALVYNNVPSSLTPSLSLSTYDIYANYLTDKVEIVDLQSITIEKISDPHNFISIGVNSLNSSFQTVVINSSASIPQNSVNIVSVRLTFKYCTGENEKSYTVDKDISIVGEVASVTKYDMSYRLQSAFTNNNYIDKQGYEFYAYGGLTPYVNGEPVQLWIDYFFEYEETAPFIDAGYTKANGYYTVNENPNNAKNYIIFTYEYVEVPHESMLTQVAYFTYDSGNDKYVLAADTSDTSVTYYERKAITEILPSKIPTFDTKTVMIYAILYTDIIDGVKTYVDPITDENNILTYTLTLTVEGIYQHNANQIADYNLYNTLRSYFDFNHDGIISATEAQADWSSLSNLSSTTINGKEYKYIDLTNLDITSLKGIEYFENVQGYCLDNTSITDISYLSTLSKLEYLDLSNNFITDVSALSYMDNLHYLNLNNNYVTSINALRHLASLHTLELQNNNVTDFEPLSSTTNLISLDITGMRQNSTYFTADGNTMYYFALIKINNPTIVFQYDTPISIPTELQVAAKVMRDLECINRIYKTLYLPSTYNYYNGTSVQQYSLAWFCSDPNLTLTSTSGVYTGYTILNPLFDKNIKLRLQVYLLGSTSSYYSISRDFKITLETSSAADTVYIYDTVNDVYVLANQIVDVNLRNLIFDTFNNVTTGTVNVNGTEISEEKVISLADYQYFANDRPATINWANAGITNLSGIEYFSQWFTMNLNLAENNLDSLAPLASLTKLVGLTLGGQSYDFSQLNGLTTLTSLDVHKCYNLNDIDTLTKLYALYIANSTVNIYIDDADTIWNPYEKYLALYVQNLTSVLPFMSQGDSYNIYGGQTGFVFNFYNMDYTFTVSSVSFYERYLKTATTGKFFKYASNKITYYKSYGYGETAYAQVTLASSDTHGTITYSDYYIELITNDTGGLIYVHNVSQYNDFTVSTVADMFAARSTKEMILPALFSWFSKTNYKIPYDSTKVTEEEIRGLLLTKTSSSKYVYYYYDNLTGHYHCTTDVFTSAGAMSGKTSLTINGVYSTGKTTIDGLKYLPTITTLTIARDAIIGDGSELANIISLKIDYSALDLTTITTPLNNLTTLTLSNCYLFIVQPSGDTGVNSAFKYMQNLTTLSVAISSSTSMRINDFSFLLGLISTNENGNSVTNLKTLTLTSIISNSTSNGISKTNAGYVKQLYLAAIRNSVTPTYKVGSTAKNSLTNAYFRVIDDLSYWCSSNSDSTKQSSWDTASSSTLDDNLSQLNDYRMTVGSATNDGNQSGYVYDLGLKYNSTYWTENRVFSLNNTDDNSITLPKSIGTTYYGIAYANSQTITKRDYQIQWTAYFTNSSGTETQFIVNKTYDEDYTISLSSLGDGYLVIIGTVLSGIAGVTNRSYLYHFIVGNGDGIYSAVTDNTLRLYLFAHRNEFTNSISITDKVSNESILSYMGYTAIRQETVSNYIYDLTGLDTVLNHLNKTTAITSVTLKNQRFSNITPLYSLTNLATLNLSCDDSIKGYVVLTGITGKFNSLVTLNLTNNISITPADIALLAETARSSLVNINLFGTRCTGSYDILSSLLAIADANTNDSINLSLNVSTVNTVTKAQLNQFLSDTSISGSTTISTMRTAGFTPDSDIYSAAETLIINEIAYTLQLLPETRQFINAYANTIYNGNIPVKVQISATEYNVQFENIYVDTYYYRSGSNIMLIGTEGKHITDFDTELIAYLMTNEYLAKDANDCYCLNRNVTVSSNIGIRKLDNISTLSNKYSLTITTGSNPLSYNSEGPITTTAMATNSNNAIGFSSTNYLYLNLIPDYSYSDSSATTFTATLPTHIWIKNVRYEITWNVSGEIANNSVSSDDFFSIDTNNNVIFTMNAANSSVPVAGVAYSNFNISATVNGTERKENIIITKNQEIVSFVGFNFMVAVTVIQNGETYYSEDGTEYSTPGDVVLLNSDNKVYYELGTIPYTTLYLKNNKYYISVNDVSNATTIYSVSWGTIFKSGRFVYHLMHTLGIKETVYNNETLPLVQYGYLLTATKRLNTTSITVAASGDTTTQGVTSIEGVQIFCNLTSFTVYAGSFSNIDALSTLHLTTFYYGNSEVATSDERNYMIYDFTPLVSGSKDSLVNFSYNTLASTQMTDLSFLLSFSVLKNVYIGSNYYDTNYNKYAKGLAYFRSQAFQYVLAKLYEKHVYIYVYKDHVTSFGLSYDPTLTKVVANDTVYALKPSANSMMAAEVLNFFNSNGAVDTSYSDNYLLTVNHYTIDNNKVQFRIPTLINQNGTLHVIEWKAGTANAIVNGYYLSDAITINGTTYSANTLLTYEQALAIAASPDYYTNEKAGLTKLYVSLSVDVGDINNVAACDYTLLVSRIYLDGYAYERMFSLKF